MSWILQQLRDALPGGHPYRFLIHDRDRIFAKEVNQVSRTWVEANVEN